MMPEPILYFRLRDVDQLAHVLRRRLPEIHHDVRVDVRYLRISVPESLETNLVDQATSPNALDFFEDRAGAWMVFQPGMFSPAPAQVLLHDPVHDRLVAALELEGDGQGDVALFMQSTGVVAELHVIAVHGTAFALFGQQLGGVEYFGDEHRSLTRGGRREKMEILPHGAANSAGYSDVMLEAGPAPLHRLRNELRDDRSALYPQLSIVRES